MLVSQLNGSETFCGKFDDLATILGIEPASNIAPKIARKIDDSKITSNVDGSEDSYAH
jgi:hypothetical protein